jgi:hypothetical protein
VKPPRLLSAGVISVLVAGSVAGTATAAPAKHGHESSGTSATAACGSIATSLSTRPGSGGVEVDYVLDQNRNRRTWHLTMTSGGAVLAQATRKTRAPGGSLTWRVIAPDGSTGISVTARRGATTCTIGSGADSSGPSQGDSIVVSKCYTNATKTTGGELLIKASSSDPTAKLLAYRPDGSLIGEVQNGGGSRYGGTVMPYQSSDPGTVTIRSSSGGSVTVPTGPFQL